MKSLISKIKVRSREFTPKLFVCFKEGYNAKTFFGDLFAGACVGIIAIPLALAFAIASGVAPEKGLYTAIIAGFFISLLGGSRVQIGGPTGAFVVLIYSIVAQFGYSGLALATFIAAILLILMGLFRFGVLLKFIPYPVIVGFTTGIALVIFTSQIKDFFGLDIATLPPHFLNKWSVYFQTFTSCNPWAVGVASLTLMTIIMLKKWAPRLPAAMVAMGAATLAVTLFHLPVETIATKFGDIPRTLPRPTLPFFSWDLVISVFPSALTVALLGAIESLLSASIADGMTGHKHRSNGELIGQGIANLASVVFGGIPATGAIARTSANINLGGRTPVAGIVHALTILILMLFFTPQVGKIPLASLSGVLIFVAWNMSELPHFIEILKGSKGDALALVATFILTVLIDLTVAVQVGVVLSAMVFLKRMTDKTTVRICQVLKKENSDESEIETEPTQFQEKLPQEIALFEINGPFFYTVSHLLDDALNQLGVYPRVFILNMRKTPLVDSTGIKALKHFHAKCRQKKIAFLIAGAKEGIFRRSNLETLIGRENLFSTTDAALAFAKSYLENPVYFNEKAWA